MCLCTGAYALQSVSNNQNSIHQASLEGKKRAKFGTLLAHFEKNGGVVGNADEDKKCKDDGQVTKQHVGLRNGLTEYLQDKMPEIPKIEVGAPIFNWSRFCYEYNIKYDGKESTKAFADIRILARSLLADDALPSNYGPFFKQHRLKQIQNFFDHVVLRTPRESSLTSGSGLKRFKGRNDWVENWNAECGWAEVRRSFEDWFANTNRWIFNRT